MNQCKRVLQYMQDFGTITPLDALADLGVMRLGARIFDLRNAGYKISRKMVSSKNRYGEVISYAEYKLED